MATLEEITDRIRRAAAAEPEFPTSIKLDLKGEGVIHVAGAQVSNDDLPADLTVTVSRRDLMALGKRELDPMRAIMSGRLRLSDMSLAMSLQPRLQALMAGAA